VTTAASSVRTALGNVGACMSSRSILAVGELDEHQLPVRSEVPGVYQPCRPIAEPHAGPAFVTRRLSASLVS